MVRMGVFGVMVMVVVVIMGMPVVMGMIMMVVMPSHLQPAFPRAERITQLAIGDVGAGGGGTLALDVVVMAFLHHANLSFKPKHLFAVFAEGAVVRHLPLLDLHHAFCELRDDLIMVVQIPGFHELYVRVLRRDLIGETIDTVNQDAGEEKVREDDDALVA